MRWPLSRFKGGPGLGLGAQLGPRVPIPPHAADAEPCAALWWTIEPWQGAVKAWAPARLIRRVLYNSNFPERPGG